LSVELLVDAAHAGERADKGLASLLAAAGKGVSRADLQRWMDDGLVTSSGVPLKRSAKLHEGMRVRVQLGSPLLTTAVPDPSVVLDVVYEDEHLLVIDKAAGLVVHPSKGHRTGTLVNGLLARGGFEAPSDPRDPDGQLRPGIVHRLDKDTSGLLVVAKDAATRESLKALFQAHDILRSYCALTVGSTATARYDTAHGRHPTHRLRFTTRPRNEQRARRAVTEVTVVEQLAHATVVRCQLETGRTHQIRVHLSECGHTPILADRLYGGIPKHEPLAAIASTLGRQALHAAELGFVHPVSKQMLRWKSPLPPDMALALDQLRAS